MGAPEAMAIVERAREAASPLGLLSEHHDPVDGRGPCDDALGERPLARRLVGAVSVDYVLDYLLPDDWRSHDDSDDVKPATKKAPARRRAPAKKVTTPTSAPTTRGRRGTNGS